MTQENTTTDLDEIDLYSIEQLIHADNLRPFYVASYQRGYRWGPNEIRFLLDDIAKVEEEQKYCLQPVTVFLNNNDKWELVDGQQRLTTIFLILAFLNNEHSLNGELYELEYETRETTSRFLNDIANENILKNYLGEDGKQEGLWEAFVQQSYIHDNIDNIDNYHLFQAYLEIGKWFQEHGVDPEDFLNKIKNRTCIIWHPIGLSEQSVEDRFIDINAGKIKLTDAELIKALFILQIQKSSKPWDIKQMQVRQLAEEWDQIEKQLQDDGFWYFIKDQNSKDFQTRIGLLFDLLSSERLSSERTKEESPYQWFAKDFEEGSEDDRKKLKWENVRHLYQRLVEWYHDIPTYHRIGFLINAGIKSLRKLENKTRGIAKSEIKKKLDTFITEELHREKQSDNEKAYRYHLDSLNYEEDKESCQKLLLLYNILLLERTFPGQRFPFDLYQQESWSIEHLHPQNPEKVKETGRAIALLQEYRERLNEFDSEEQRKIEKKITEIESKLPNDENGQLSDEAQDMTKEFTEEYNDAFDLHDIGNLVLLDKNTNSEISNKPFADKRHTVLSQENNKYIPLATLDCFMKKYTKESLQLNHWSKEDIEAYKESIKTVLGDYLPTENN